jgi:dipeptidyl aminopeptidase/acylaminoacyl peptidase
MSVAREPQLYRCAIGLSGAYDLSKLYRWGDIHRSDYGMHYLNVVLGGDKQTLQAHSPTALASAIKVPVLLAHGTMDARVPIKHAKEMRSALEDAGDPPEFVTYDWEGHGLSDPAHLKDFYGRLIRLLEKSLAPETK